MAHFATNKLESLSWYINVQLGSLALYKNTCRVAGGLDSLVLGEGQILAQVKQVYKVGQTCEGFGRHLNGLFKQASFLLGLSTCRTSTGRHTLTS